MKVRTRSFAIGISVAASIAVCATATFAPQASAANKTKSTKATTKRSKTQVAKAFPVTLTNGKTKVTIAKKPVRIVSISPTATEMLFAMGAGKQVIAVDDQSNYPASAPRTKLSGYNTNLEAVVAFKPDLVVASAEDNATEGLRALKVPVLVQLAANTIDDSYAQLNELGLATGNPIAATEVVNEMKAKIATLKARVPASAKGLTYFHELDNTLYTVTSKTFVGQLYAMVGLVNVADTQDKDATGYPQLSAEYLVSADPDFVFLADTKCCAQDSATVAARSGWANLKSVKNKNVVTLDDDIASRWGPRAPMLLEQIVKAVEAKALAKA